jgi:hypothetical protein
MASLQAIDYVTGEPLLDEEGHLEIRPSARQKI